MGTTPKIQSLLNDEDLRVNYAIEVFEHYARSVLLYNFYIGGGLLPKVLGEMDSELIVVIS
jgi:hypothetical protein